MLQMDKFYQKNLEFFKFCHGSWDPLGLVNKTLKMSFFFKKTFVFTIYV